MILWRTKDYCRSAATIDETVDRIGVATECDVPRRFRVPDRAGGVKKTDLAAYIEDGSRGNVRSVERLDGSGARRRSDMLKEDGATGVHVDACPLRSVEACVWTGNKQVRSA